MRREIVTFPAPILHQVAKTVEKIDDSIRDTLSDMVETMYAEQGVGIAAPQIGVPLRMVAVDITGCEGDTGLGVVKMVNPEIIEREGEIDFEEGCLSVPGFRKMMKRSRRLKVKFLDEKGNKKELDVEGLFAVVVQQELDHIDGKLIIDTASPLKQDLYLKKIKKAK